MALEDLEKVVEIEGLKIVAEYVINVLRSYLVYTSLYDFLCNCSARRPTHSTSRSKKA